MQEFIEQKSHKSNITKIIVLFTFLLYSPELNKIVKIFGRIKTRISFANLNSKDFDKVIKKK